MPQTFILDTGSPTTTSPCSKCTSCGKHLNKYYEFIDDSKIIKCSTQECNYLSSSCSNSQCSFSISYSEGSSLRGFFNFQDISFENLNRNGCVHPSSLTQQRNRNNSNNNNNNNNSNDNNSNSISNNNTENNNNNILPNQANESSNSTNSNNTNQNYISINITRRSRPSRYAEPPPPIPSPKHQEPDPENHIIKNLGADGYSHILK